MNKSPWNKDDRMAAAAVASLSTAATKRCRDKQDNDVEVPLCTMTRSTQQEIILSSELKTAPHTTKNIRVLRAAPFFFYSDFSEEKDIDPLTPLTPPGRVPNFPAKMHAILSSPELTDIIAWLPHGRSWRVLKPREFEIKVLPKFFEHVKFSSFVRQANGWGFRRLTQGNDRNSYYHERFLRGLPHVSKHMKRPAVSEKKAANPNHEPQFYEIAKLHPLPEKMEQHENILMLCTLQGGPSRVRVPIFGPGGSVSVLPFPIKVRATAAQTVTTPVTFSSKAVEASLVSLQQQKAHEEKILRARAQSMAAVVAPSPSATALDSTHCTSMQVLSYNPFLQFPYHSPAIHVVSRPAGAALNSSASADFAAGFAAATAYNQCQFRKILNSLHQYGKAS